MGISSPAITSVMRPWQPKTVSIRIHAMHNSERCADLPAIFLVIDLSPFEFVARLKASLGVRVQFK
jgi:hypothetical protein